MTQIYDKDEVSDIFPIICNAFFEEKKNVVKANFT